MCQNEQKAQLEILPHNVVTVLNQILTRFGLQDKMESAKTLSR